MPNQKLPIYKAQQNYNGGNSLAAVTDLQVVNKDTEDSVVNSIAQSKIKVARTLPRRGSKPRAPSLRLLRP